MSYPSSSAAATPLALLRPPNVASLQNQMEMLLNEVVKIDSDWHAREVKLELERATLEADNREEKRKLAEEFERNEQEIKIERGRFADEMTRKEQELDCKKREMQNKFEAKVSIFNLEKQELAKREQTIDEIQDRVVDIVQRDNPITVEVGGDKFHTQIETLVKYKESIFPDLIRALQTQRHTSPPRHGDQHSKQSNIFIDRDGKHFKLILNFMRQGEEVMKGAALKNVDETTLYDMLCEVHYYKLRDLERLLERRMVEFKKVLTLDILAKAGYFTSKFQVPAANVTVKLKTSKKLAIKDCNLSGIVFDQILFDEEASFEGCVMTRASFQRCVFHSVVSFKNTDLSEAKFINCSGVAIDRFYLKDTNMTKVDFSPPLPN